MPASGASEQSRTTDEPEPRTDDETATDEITDPVPEGSEHAGSENGASEHANGEGVHRMANRGDWPWLPTQNCGHLAPHPYCEHCGQVKAVGTQRALDHGGLVNLLARLKRVLDRENLTMTEVQRRLILKKLKEEDVDDPFGLTRERQLELVTEIASRYLGMHEEMLATYLRSC